MLMLLSAATMHSPYSFTKHLPKLQDIQTMHSTDPTSKSSIHHLVSTRRGNVLSLIKVIERGVMLSGVLPIPFPMISLRGDLTPNKHAPTESHVIDTEEVVKAQPMVGDVLVRGCIFLLLHLQLTSDRSEVATRFAAVLLATH